MLINWFTVAAQIVNFMILVALLKRFLYGPVLAAMSAREGRIAAQLDEAERKRLEVEEEESSLRGKIRDVEGQRAEMLAGAARQADLYKEELFLEARREVDQVREKWASSLKDEKEAFLQNIKQRMGQEAMAVARRALMEMGNLELEECLIQAFLDRFQSLPSEEKAAIRGSIDESGGELLVNTAFEMAAVMQRKIGEEVKIILGDNLSIRFSTSGEILAGIELSTSSRKLAWSLGGYLDNLEEELAEGFRTLGKTRSDEG